MKKNATVKIFAAIALFGIIIGIVGTAILFIIQGGATPQQAPQVLTEEELQQIINETGIDFDQAGSGEILEPELGEREEETIEQENSDEIIVEEALIQE